MNPPFFWCTACATTPRPQVSWVQAAPLPAYSKIFKFKFTLVWLESGCCKYIKKKIGYWTTITYTTWHVCDRARQNQLWFRCKNVAWWCWQKKNEISNTLKWSGFKWSFSFSKVMDGWQRFLERLVLVSASFFVKVDQTERKRRGIKKKEQRWNEQKNKRVKTGSRFIPSRVSLNLLVQYLYHAYIWGG